MIVENINNYGTRPKILIAPLDWGLGHATRCIPIITELNKYAEVVIAAEGAVVILLQQEFPALQFINLPGYRIKYSRNKRMFAIRMLLQIPAILSAIRQEKKWLQNIIEKEKIDAVISDNRFGLSHPGIPCIYITHQLFIQTGNAILNRLVQQIHYRYINTFTRCWIPDQKTNGLAGILSHPVVFPRTPVEYIGTLSRCTRQAVIKKYDYLLLISGPEPQRSIFEKMLIEEFEVSAFSFVLLRGMPGNTTSLKINNSKGIVYDHLPAEALSRLMQESAVVIARSGYSTIMDLAALQQNAVLVSTPGQTEQEYLAKFLMGKNMFYSVSQEDFSLQHVSEKMKTWQPDLANVQSGMDADMIRQWTLAL